MNKLTKWQEMKERALVHAQLVITKDMTIRQIEAVNRRKGGVRKNAIHRDLTITLPKVSPVDAAKVRAILAMHKSNPSKYRK